MTALASFGSVRTVGAVLPGDALARAVDLRMPGQSAEEYQLTPGMAVNAAVARAWEASLGAYRAWQAALEKLPPDDPAEGLTRNRWLLPLLYELGFGRPEALRGGIETPPALGESEPMRFPISHRLAWPDATDVQAGAPMHLVGARVALDVRTPGVAARAPQSMLQDLLNRHPRYLWGIVANGHLLRVLRDGSSLARQAYVEFDLDDIFGNQRYADFRLFFLTVHASRFAPVAPDPPADDGHEEEAPAAPLSPESCLLERWRTSAIESGARALAALRLGVARAIEHLGTGFVSHPANTALRSALAEPDADKDLHRALLRIAYRLIVLFVAEDRELLHTGSRDAAAQARYAGYFSTARLRRLATSRAGTRHTDLWPAHLIVTDALAGDGLPVLALPGLAASLFHRDALGLLADAEITNRAFLAAVRELAQIVDPVTGVPRPVDYRHLDSEELGGVYEGLLVYQPRYDAAARTFTLAEAKGNDRKKSGAYYTPAPLIALALDEALDPLIAEAVRTPDPEAALLALTVVDPAVGSGHFVVAAARRIAAALATVRTASDEPSPAELRTATADVIGRCVYGVDVQDLAIEIAKVALWLEAFDGSRPLPFLDAHFKVGDALLGATPKLLAEGVPDAAFAALTGDDAEWTTKLKARNKTERTQPTLGDGVFAFATSDLAKRAREIDDPTAMTLVAARERADAWRLFDADPELAARRRVADTWCAAFVQRKHPDVTPAITHDTVRCVAADPMHAPEDVLAAVAELARRYRFFHWHLEFPTIFTAPEPGAADVDPATGWQGGFSCVLGNPPWERVKIQDKEFFAAKDRPEIADAKTAAIRAKMINRLAREDPGLAEAYLAELHRSDRVANLLRRGGRYPLTGHGDVNTYSVFAETFRTILAPDGSAGIVTPTGLATDKTTAPFFGALVEQGSLAALHDFVTNPRIWSDIGNRRFRFAVTAFRGRHRPVERARMSFLSRYPTEVVPERVFEIAPHEITLVNPNTGNCPTFLTRTDADITLGIYRRHPVLVRDGAFGGNPWKVTFGTLFHMSGDSELFHGPDDLPGSHFDGWAHRRDGREYLPLYEAKLVSHFDHRLSSYALRAPESRDTELPRLTDAMHDNPSQEAGFRHWVDRSIVEPKLTLRWDRAWVLGWRNIAKSTDMRTFIPSVLPASAVGDVFPLAFLREPALGPLLHAVWSSLAFDYVARQKISGTHLTYTVLRQLACPGPETFDEPAPWHPDRSLARWVRPYVLELSYTSSRLHPYALDMRDEGPPFRWDAHRRELLRADLDAAFLHVYGLTRAEAEHVLDSFGRLQRKEVEELGEYRTRRLVLDAYDRMAAAIARGGSGWTTLADIPAGTGPRHPAR